MSVGLCSLVCLFLYTRLFGFLKNWFLLVPVLLATTALVFLLRLEKRHHLNRNWTSFWCTATIVLTVLCGLERFFVYYPETHGLNFAKAAHNWARVYWNPINSIGFRDLNEPHDPGFNPTNVVVLGDSFVAGHGINDVSDRFQNQLERSLGKQYRFYTVAQNGWNTRDQLRALHNYPLIPHHLLYVYFGNDIDYLAAEAGVDLSFSPFEGRSSWLRYLVKNSYLADFLFWKFLPNPSNIGNKLITLYRSPQILEKHLEDVKRIFKWANGKGIRTQLVIFPFLNQIDESLAYREPLQRVAAEHNVDVHDVSTWVTDWPAEQRVISRKDMHASIQIHNRLASKMVPTFLAISERTIALPHPDTLEAPIKTVRK